MLFYMPISENQLDGFMSNGIPSGATLYEDINTAREHGDAILNIDARRIDEGNIIRNGSGTYQYSLNIPSSMIIGYQRN